MGSRIIVDSRKKATLIRIYNGDEDENIVKPKILSLMQKQY